MELTVKGMHCEGCIGAVRRFVAAAAPRAQVRVDLGSGRVSITGEAERQAVIAAIERAGYLVEGK